MAMNGNGAGAAPMEAAANGDGAAANGDGAAANGNGAAGGDAVVLAQPVADWLKLAENRHALYDFLEVPTGMLLTSELLQRLLRWQIRWVMKTLDEQSQWTVVGDIVEGLPVYDMLSKHVIDEIMKTAAQSPLQLSKMVLEEILKNEIDPLETLTAAVENLHEIRGYVGRREYFNPPVGDAEVAVELPMSGEVTDMTEDGEWLLVRNLGSMRRTVAFLFACLFRWHAAVPTEKRKVIKLLYKLGLSEAEVATMMQQVDAVSTKVSGIKASLQQL